MIYIKLNFNLQKLIEISRIKVYTSNNDFTVLRIEMHCYNYDGAQCPNDLVTLTVVFMLCKDSAFRFCSWRGIVFHKYVLSSLFFSIESVAASSNSQPQPTPEVSLAGSAGDGKDGGNLSVHCIY